MAVWWGVPWTQKQLHIVQPASQKLAMMGYLQVAVEISSLVRPTLALLQARQRSPFVGDV